MYHPRFQGNHYNIGLKFGKILRKKNIGHIDGIEYAKDILRGKYGFMCQYDKRLNFDTI